MWIHFIRCHMHPSPSTYTNFKYSTVIISKIVSDTTSRIITELTESRFNLNVTKNLELFMFQNTHSNRKDFLFILHEYLGFPPNRDITSFTIRYYTRLICNIYRQYTLQRDYLPSAFSHILCCAQYFTSFYVSVTVGSRGGLCY